MTSFAEKLKALGAGASGVDLEQEKKRAAEAKAQIEKERYEKLVTFVKENILPHFEKVNDSYLEGRGTLGRHWGIGTWIAEISLEWDQDQSRGRCSGLRADLRGAWNEVAEEKGSVLKISGAKKGEVTVSLKDDGFSDRLQDAILEILSDPENLHGAHYSTGAVDEDQHLDY